MLCRTLIVVLSLAYICQLAAAESSRPVGSSLSESFTAEEFVRAGLNKLTPEELAFLETRLMQKPSRPPVIATKSSGTVTPGPRRPAAEKGATDFGAEQIAPAQPLASDSALRTHVEGTVQEFSGRAVFVLANGQIWQQRTPAEVVLPKKLVNPAVTLVRGAIGYKMIIEAANVVVFVKRIQ